MTDFICVKCGSDNIQIVRDAKKNSIKFENKLNSEDGKIKLFYKNPDTFYLTKNNIKDIDFLNYGVF